MELGERLAEATRARTAEEATRQTDRLAREVPNLLAVRQRFLERDPILAARAVRAALPVLTRRRSPRGLVDLLEEASDRDALVRLDALEATLRAELGQVRSARALIERARPAAEEREDAVGLAVLRFAEAYVWLAEGEGAAAAHAVLEDEAIQELAEQTWGVRYARERLRQHLADEA